MAGTLFIVSTPIGNLEDVTLRALGALKSADIIAAEDTRRSRKLLSHFEIKAKKLIPYHDYNKKKQIPKIIESLKNGKSVALVSDAGTPLINDPGFELIREAIQKDIKVVPIPGVSAPLTALTASGLPPYPFIFLGYLPKKEGKRRKFLKNLKGTSFPEFTPTFIALEAPQRVKGSLKDLTQTWGEETQVSLAREMTKVHEEFLRGSAKEVLQEIKKKSTLKGEVTLVWRKPKE